MPTEITLQALLGTESEFTLAQFAGPQVLHLAQVSRNLGHAFSRKALGRHTPKFCVAALQQSHMIYVDFSIVFPFMTNEVLHMLYCKKQDVLVAGTASGFMAWKSEAEEQCLWVQDVVGVQAMSMSDCVVLVASSHGDVLALDVKSGSLMWQFCMHSRVDFLEFEEASSTLLMVKSNSDGIYASTLAVQVDKRDHGEAELFLMWESNTYTFIRKVVWHGQSVYIAADECLVAYHAPSGKIAWRKEVNVEQIVSMDRCVCIAPMFEEWPIMLLDTDNGHEIGPAGNDQILPLSMLPVQSVPRIVIGGSKRRGHGWPDGFLLFVDPSTRQEVYNLDIEFAVKHLQYDDSTGKVFTLCEAVDELSHAVHAWDILSGSRLFTVQRAHTTSCRATAFLHIGKYTTTYESDTNRSSPVQESALPINEFIEHEEPAIEISPEEASVIVAEQHATWLYNNADALGNLHEASDQMVDRSFEHVLLLQFSRSPECFDSALAQGPELEHVRHTITQAGYHWRLPGGAKVFVSPEIFPRVRALLPQYTLQPCHVVVSEFIEPIVLEAVSNLPSRRNVRLRSSVPLAYMDDAAVIVVQRTFLQQPAFSMLQSQSVIQSTAEAHGGLNPRRHVISD